MTHVHYSPTFRRNPILPHEIAWNGLNDSGGPVSSGVYFVKMTCGREAQTVKVTLMR